MSKAEDREARGGMVALRACIDLRRRLLRPFALLFSASIAEILSFSALGNAYLCDPTTFRGTRD